MFEKPYSFAMTPGGFYCIYRDGRKIAEITSHENGRNEAINMIFALNSRHNYLKNKNDGRI